MEDFEYNNLNYSDFINNILKTRGRFNVNGYKERHHIIPKCLNGNNNESNLIDLTPYEHFIAHYLLVKEHPNNISKILNRVKKNKESNITSAKKWRYDFYKLFNHTLEYFRKFKKQKESIKLYKDIINLSPEEQKIKVEVF